MGVGGEVEGGENGKKTVLLLTGFNRTEAGPSPFPRVAALFPQKGAASAQLYCLAPVASAKAYKSFSGTSGIHAHKSPMAGFTLDAVELDGQIGNPRPGIRSVCCNAHKRTAFRVNNLLHRKCAMPFSK